MLIGNANGEMANRRNTCPDIPDNWKGGITDVARVLGDKKPVSLKTVKKYLLVGGIKVKAGKNKRLQFSGKEVKRLWGLL